jgi:hypothetical protein
MIHTFPMGRITSQTDQEQSHQEREDRLIPRLGGAALDEIALGGLRPKHKVGSSNPTRLGVLANDRIFRGDRFR